MTLLRRHRNDGEKGLSSDVFIVNCWDDLPGIQDHSGDSPIWIHMGMNIRRIPQIFLSLFR